MNLTGQSVRVKIGKPPKDRDHMHRVKQLPCVICNAPPPSDAHHVYHDRHKEPKNDRRTIPLCKECHQTGPQSVHRDKAGWAERNGPDYKLLPLVADMLNGEWNR